MYNKKSLLLFLLIPLSLLTGCYEPDPDPKASSKESFDPSIIKTLKAYNLSLSDFEEAREVSAKNRQSSGSRVVSKTLTIGNERIAYFETSGKGPDILLIHGNAQSSKSYSFQLNSLLGSIFHIISIDLPGHGSSQPSPNPAVTYQVPGYADLLVDIVDALDMEQAVIVGWSLGGNILLEASDRLTDARGLMILGTSPVANPFDPGAFIPSQEFGLLFKPDLTEEEIQVLAPTLFRPGFQNIPEMFYQDVRIQDPLARLFLGVTIGTGNYKDQVEIVGNLSAPLAVLDGEHEQVASIAYQQGLTIPTLWHNRVWVIPHAGHMAQWENPSYFNVLLAAFVIDVNSNI